MVYAMYTDDAKWRKRPLSRFPFAYHSSEGLVEIPYDIIKVKEHRSEELIRHHSLLVKLLTLKADDAGCDRKQLVCEIYRATAVMGDLLSEDKLLLVDRFVAYYAKVPKRDVNAIKKESGMSFVASTITEHYEHIGEERGEILGSLKTLKRFIEKGFITQEQFEIEAEPLREQLSKLNG